MHKNNLKQQVAATIKNKRCWLTFCATFAVALTAIAVSFNNSEVNASTTAMDATLESVENEIYNEEFSEPDNDFIADHIDISFFIALISRSNKSHSPDN